MQSRELKFRGKSVRTGEWVYGTYHKVVGTGEMADWEYKEGGNGKLIKTKHDFDMHWILTPRTPSDVGWSVNDTIIEYCVVKESVGQFTGLKDKNGVEIYEGDICEQITPNHTKIKMVCRWGTVQRTMDTGWTVDISGFCFERSDGLMALLIVKNWMGKHDLETLEVIGNLHEHPHLLQP